MLSYVHSSRRPVSKTSRIRLLALGAIAVLAFGMLAALAHADITPTLSLSPNGDGDTVTVNVTGDPSEAVELFYQRSGAGSQIAFLGDTNASGILSATVSSSSDGIVTGTPVYVAVGGINGIHSATMNWPVVTSTSIGGSITFSQSSMVVTVGQSESVTATNNTSGTLYVSNNSNPSVANVSVSGNVVTATGIAYGSTTVTVCSTTNTSNCPSIYITVQNSGTGTLSFSQSTLTVAPGQTVPVTVSGGDSGVYTILNNTNPSVIFASIAGSTVTIGTTATSGTASLTVCTADSTSCGIINVTAGTTTSGVVTFSQQYPTLVINQSTTVAIYGGSGSYYISSNTNPNAVGASISSSVLTLTGLTTGTSTVTVCSSTGGCGTISATTSYTSTGGALTLSQSSLSLLSGQTLSVTLSGGEAPYTLSNPTSAMYSASISGNVLSVTGLSTGSTQIPVCSSAGGCVWLSLIVNGSGSTGGLSLSQSSLTLTIGQTTTVSVYGSGTYYISANNNPSVATASINSNLVEVTATGNGSDTLTICQSGGACSSVYVTVGTGSTTGSLSLSQSSLSLTPGQNTVVSIYGSGTYYISTNANPSVVSAAVNLNSVDITAAAAGSDTLTVCQSGGSCASIYVTVNGSGVVGSTGQAALLSFGTPLETLGYGQLATLSIAGGTGSYYVAYSSNPSIVTATVSGSTLSLLGSEASGLDIVVVCSSTDSCGALPVAIGAVASTGTTVTTTTTASSGTTYVFTQYLKLGSEGTEVVQLQKVLGQLGYFNGNDTGYFGALTEQAVKAFQSAHGIAAVGYVGPSTRAALNTAE